jgi:hypothetical protein
MSSRVAALQRLRLSIVSSGTIVVDQNLAFADGGFEAVQLVQTSASISCRIA